MKMGLSTGVSRDNAAQLCTFGYNSTASDGGLGAPILLIILFLPGRAGISVLICKFSHPN